MLWLHIGMLTVEVFNKKCKVMPPSKWATDGFWLHFGALTVGVYEEKWDCSPPWTTHLLQQLYQNKAEQPACLVATNAEWVQWIWKLSLNLHEWLFFQINLHEWLFFQINLHEWLFFQKYWPAYILYQMQKQASIVPRPHPFWLEFYKQTTNK